MTKFKNTFEKRTLVEFGRLAAAFVVGIILTLISVGWSRFEFDWKIGAANILTLLFSVFLTFMLQNAIVSRQSDDRIEKDLLISQAQRVAKRVVKIAAACRGSALEGENKSAKLVLNDFKTLSSELYTLEQLLDLTPIKLEVQRVRELRSDCLGFKQLVTGGGFPSAPLSPDENGKIQVHATAIESTILKLIFYVNRL